MKRAEQPRRRLGAMGLYHGDMGAWLIVQAGLDAPTIACREPKLLRQCWLGSCLTARGVCFLARVSINGQIELSQRPIVRGRYTRVPSTPNVFGVIFDESTKQLQSADARGQLQPAETKEESIESKSLTLVMRQKGFSEARRRLGLWDTLL